MLARWAESHPTSRPLYDRRRRRRRRRPTRCRAAPRLRYCGASLCLRATRIERSQLQARKLIVHRDEIGLVDARKRIGMTLQLGGENAVDALPVVVRRAVAALGHREQVREAIVDLDEEVERILGALIPDLIDLLLHAGRVLHQR